MASKYKAPENPYDQFKSDIARELTANTLLLSVDIKRIRKFIVHLHTN